MVVSTVRPGIAVGWKLRRRGNVCDGDLGRSLSSFWAAGEMLRDVLSIGASLVFGADAMLDSADSELFRWRGACAWRRRGDDFSRALLPACLTFLPLDLDLFSILFVVI